MLPVCGAQDVRQHVADLRFHEVARDLVWRERIRDRGAALAVWHQRALDNMNLCRRSIPRKRNVGTTRSRVRRPWHDFRIEAHGDLLPGYDQDLVLLASPRQFRSDL